MLGEENIENPPLGNFTKVAIGNNHACALKDDQTVHCWGDNGFGELNVPTGKFVDVDAGGEFSCAVRENGELTCWGREGITPAKIIPTGKFKSVSLNVDADGCALDFEGKAVCWGIPEAQDVAFSEVSTGFGFGCGLNADGRAICWGGSTYLYNDVAPTDKFKQISAEGVHACGVTMDNEVKCWGSNTDGQLDVPTF